MSWKIVTKDVDMNDPLVKQLFKEAGDAAPPRYVAEKNESTVVMLPRNPLKDRCRLCGKEEILTKEHIPPFSSGNKSRHKIFTLDDWLRDKMIDNPGTKHLIEQGGIFGYTLCRSCNSLTGRLYGNEYKNWVSRAKEMIDGFGTGTIQTLNTLVGPFGEEIKFGNKVDGGVCPGAFVRQILSCMCSLSGAWNLAEKYPVLRRIILDQSKERLPDGMELGMSLYFGPRIRIVGPQLSVDMKTKTWRWLQEIAFPPFAFQLAIASNNNEPGLGLLIDNMTMVSPDEKQSFTGIVEMGFGWSPYPGDYRSKAAIEFGRKKIIDNF
jgi:hypothetical protein